MTIIDLVDWILMKVIPMRLIPLRGGDEYDALTSWRRVLRWRSGERAEAKRRFRRRERQEMKKKANSYE